VASRREEILSNLEAALGNITVAGGYNYDIKFVARRLIPPARFSLADLPGAVLVDERELVAYFGQREIRTLIAYILAVMDAAEEEASTKLNSFVEDIFKAIGTDPTRGGRAIDTQVTAVESFQLPTVPRCYAKFWLAIPYPELNLAR